MTQIGTKFSYVFKLHRSDLHTKISFHVQHIIFYKSLEKFEYINIYCSFLMTQIGTKFWYVFKLHRSDCIPKLVIIFRIFFLQGSLKILIH